METLELNDEGGGQAPDAHPLHGVPLLGALLTEVGIVTLEQLALHVLAAGLKRGHGGVNLAPVHVKTARLTQYKPGY